MSDITQKHIDAILTEAKHAKLPAPAEGVSRAAAVAPQAVSFSSFKASWPKTVRPIIMAAIGFLQMFHLTSYANYAAQAVAFIDLVISGQMPVTP